MPLKKNSNLIPFDERTESERREIAVEGGKASGESRRKRKALREAFESLLASEISVDLAEALNEKVTSLGIDTTNFTVNDYIALAQIINAIKGDNKSFEIIRDTVGEKPVEKIAHAEIDPAVLEKVERIVKETTDTNDDARTSN